MVSAIDRRNGVFNILSERITKDCETEDILVLEGGREIGRRGQPQFFHPHCFYVTVILFRRFLLLLFDPGRKKGDFGRA